MLRILVLCARDWQHPRATGVERYVYEVFRRVAAEGNYVVWLCQNHGGIPLMRPRAQTLEQVDGIQLARLGAKALYRAMTGLFFSRMAGSDGVLRQFDVVVDCVTGRPFPVSKYTATPLVPIVFRLSPGLQEPLGPIIAPTEQACSDLRNAGVPRGHVIRAPFGCAECPLPFSANATETPSITGFVESAQPFSRAMRRLSARFERPVEGTVAGPARGLMPHVRQLNAVSVVGLPLAQVSGAWVAYCGEGCEWRALDFADAGIPVVCPDTPLGREFVKAGETGLLHCARDSAHLADVLESLLRDETLRRRLANEAKSRVPEASWDRSASLLLAALENLCYSGKELLSPVPSL
jgi:hypothetical protein